MSRVRARASPAYAAFGGRFGRGAELPSESASLIRYAILSDVHANLEALTAVLDDADAHGARVVLSLGDTVGYGADPLACIDRLDERAGAKVAGNHEYGALGRLDLEWFNPVARSAALWTQGQLDAEHGRYLEALPVTTIVEDATLVHASPRRPDEWEYLISATDGFEVFGHFETRLCFVGHSHRPGVWSLGSSGPRYTAAATPSRSRIRLEDGRRYVVNVGSVGQPRDRDPRAAYAIWDRDDRSITIRRVDYDYGTAARKIIAAGLPRVLADRLAHGL